ncbi:MAG: acetyl-CoA acetyltransferase [Myxococcota bacterium]
MRDDRTPVLVGAGQLVQRDADPREALNPIAMAKIVARAAAEDAGAGNRALREIDTIGLVNLDVRSMHNPARLVADAVGAHPRREYISEIGGQVGVTLANFIAQKIARGETRSALIAGTNNMRTQAKARKAGIELDWPTGGEGEPELLGKFQPGSSERETRYGMRSPPDIYPIFENALRAARGLDLETHRLRMGALFSRFSEVAAANPYSWFPTYRSPENLTTVTRENRMIAYPYPKYLNAVLATDQAAALLMMSVEAARALGIPEERWVYWWGGAQAQEQAWWPSERPDFSRCPSMLDASLGALYNAGVSVDEIDLFDFYSCFPVAVEVAAQQLGLNEDDPRGFTVTGGLPYAGGPASAYCLHSIANMALHLRERPSAKGLVTGNGWYLTKHAASVWSSGPPECDALSAELPEDLPAPLSPPDWERAPAPAVENPRGKGTVEAYTVIFDREGAPVRGIVLGRTESQERFLANTPADRDLLEAFVTREEVGRVGRLGERDGLACFEPL